jgi:hypothetical protein
LPDEALATRLRPAGAKRATRLPPIDSVPAGCGATFLLRAPPRLPAGHPSRGPGTDSRTIPRMPDRPPPAPQHDAPS